jgi:soluble lytic murein transglycosylase-like protein
MNWVKCLIIALGLTLVAQVALARDIRFFTDSQGTLHITNLEPKKRGSPAPPPSVDTSPAPSFSPPSPAPPPAMGPTPEVQTPVPPPEAAPAAPRPGHRVSLPEGSGRLMPAADRTGRQDEPGIGAGGPFNPLRPVAWSPPEPVGPVPRGEIVVRRDRHGVIHITNVPLEGEGPAAPLTPAPAVQRQTRPPPVPLPVLQQVSYPMPAPAAVVQRQRRPPEAPPAAGPERSCPELGPEVAAYLETKLRDHSRGMAGDTIQRYRDRRGVWHICTKAPPDRKLPPARLAASPIKAAMPALAHAPPLSPAAPALAWGPGFGRPPPGAPDRTVIARRDRRGVLHIFSRASAQFFRDRDSPASFLGRISPDQQAYIIEAAQLYRLPVSLVLALIRHESNFTPQAVSPKGAMGLMQLMPGTAASLGVRDPFNPRENILAGCRYFRLLLNYFQGSVPLALAAYNAGYQRVISAGLQVPPIKETREFVTQVMGLYYLLEKHVARL